MYVLPAAFTIVPGSAPSITAVTLPSSGSTAATNVAGTNLTANTRILLDGAPAQVLAANKDGSLDIVQPPALSGMQATVEAVNPDGQTSLQSLGATPAPLLTYPQSNAPQIYQTPDIVTAGTDTLMVISGVNTHFADGQTVIGFGSSDISVRGKWVVGPQMVILNLSVDPAAQPGTTYITVATGLEIVTAANMLNVAAASPNEVSLKVPIVNAVTGLTGVPAGGTARIVTTGLPADLTGWTLTVGPQPAAFTADKNGVLTVQVPSLLAVGEQPVQLTPPASATLPAIQRVILQLDPPPPLILWGVDTPVPDWRPGSAERIESGAARRERDGDGLRAVVAKRNFARGRRAVDEYRRHNLSGDRGHSRARRSQLDGAATGSGLRQFRGAHYPGLGSNREQSKRTRDGRNRHSLVGGLCAIHSARAATAARALARKT